MTAPSRRESVRSRVGTVRVGPISSASGRDDLTRVHERSDKAELLPLETQRQAKLNILARIKAGLTRRLEAATASLKCRGLGAIVRCNPRVSVRVVALVAAPSDLFAPSL